MGSKNDVYSDPFNLIEKLTNKITKVSTKNRNIVIIGESGSGKTLLLYKLENDLR
jgi:DNA-binding NtrC family response regulator